MRTKSEFSGENTVLSGKLALNQRIIWYMSFSISIQLQTGNRLKIPSTSARMTFWKKIVLLSPLYAKYVFRQVSVQRSDHTQSTVLHCIRWPIHFWFNSTARPQIRLRQAMLVCCKDTVTSKSVRWKSTSLHSWLKGVCHGNFVTHWGLSSYIIENLWDKKLSS